MKVMRGQKRPRLPFPKVFGVIDRAMKACYLGQRTEMLDPDMPPGVISQADRWVESAGLNIPGSSVVSEIHGSLDALIHCDDGSVGVVDFKTAALNADLLGTYSRQLHAYAFALEQPGSGPPLQVSALGLLCFLPDAFTTGHHAALTGQLKWLEIERDDTAFLRFLIEVAGILDEPEPPSASAECTWCGWGARTGVS
jgi:hypothetical protein